MRVFTTRWFVRFARKEKITDELLLDAVDRAERGLIDADLGEGLIKQRAARPGRGRSKGYRVLIAFDPGNRAVFLFGFAKSDMENLAPDVLKSYRGYAAVYLAESERQIEVHLESGALTEVKQDGEE